MKSSELGISQPYSTKYPCALGSKCQLHDSCREYCQGLALHLDGIALEDHDGVKVMVRSMME